MNGDLFADADLSIDELNQLPPVEVLEAWPKTLRDLMDVYTAKWLRRGFADDEAEKMAFDVVKELSLYCGGRPLYIPQGKQLTTAFRDRSIFKEFETIKTADLAKKYNLTVTQIYNIYHKQRSLFIKKRQSDLFPAD